jgi:hypothetical protein
MWKLKCLVAPIIIGATGIATKGLMTNFGSHTGKTFNRFTREYSNT